MSDFRPPVFDSGERTDPAPAGQAEATFTFLNRIRGSFWEYPRRLIQTWADNLASGEDYRDLRGRLRSPSDYVFRSAFLELYVHEALRSAGYTVTVHPTVSGSSRRPDFLAEREDLSMYVEAIEPAPSPAAQAAQARQAVLLDTVNRLGDPNFMLWLDALSEGPRPPSGARLRRDLRRWLVGLDPDDYVPFDLATAPTFRWEHEGWSVTFKAIPKRVGARGPAVTGDRAIGVYAHTPVTLVNDAPTIRGALLEKHGAYGHPDRPLVIAVGLHTFDRDRWHAANALYGSEAVQFGETGDGEPISRLTRQGDGYFGNPCEWQNRHVSGVLIVNQLRPEGVPQADAALWLHPGAEMPIGLDHGLPVDTVHLVDGEIVTTPPDTPASDHFGLPEPWPPGVPWEDDS